MLKYVKKFLHYRFVRMFAEVKYIYNVEKKDNYKVLQTGNKRVRDNVFKSNSCRKQPFKKSGFSNRITPRQIIKKI